MKIIKTKTKKRGPKKPNAWDYIKSNKVKIEQMREKIAKMTTKNKSVMRNRCSSLEASVRNKERDL